jgi:hypothetical protein
MDAGNHFTSDTAQVVAGAATAAGGYLYFTKTQGWRVVLGAAVTFGGGWIGHEAVTNVIGNHHGLASGIAATATLGVIFSVRKAAAKLDAAQWLEGRK